MTLTYNNYNDLNHKGINISYHAKCRAKERLKWKSKNDNELVANLRVAMSNSRYVGIVPDEEGKESLLYACGRVGYYISMDKKELITIIPEEKTIESPLQLKIIELHKKEIRKLSRKESARLKKLYEMELRNKMEMATLEYKIHRSRSVKAQEEYRNRIGMLNRELAEMQNEIDVIRKEKKKLSRSLVAII